MSVARFVSLVDETGTPAAGLESVLDGLLPADLCILGMGEDKHTASLFPGSAELGPAIAANAPGALPVVAPDGERRVTLTCQALGRSRSLHLLIDGPAKRAVLAEARQETDPLVSPVSAFLDAAHVHYVAGGGS